MVSPLGKHRREKHSGNDFDVKCTISALETDISAQKTRSCVDINRTTAMNSKNEQLSITKDLMPFIGLYEL